MKGIKKAFNIGKTQDVEIPQTVMMDYHKPGCGNTTSKDAGKPQTYINVHRIHTLDYFIEYFISAFRAVKKKL